MMYLHGPGRSVDLFQLDGKHYRVTVDHYSDYFELDSLRIAAASAVIQAMKQNFARHGIPDECISDNEPQFDSHENENAEKKYLPQPKTESIFSPLKRRYPKPVTSPSFHKPKNINLYIYRHHRQDI